MRASRILALASLAVLIAGCAPTGPGTPSTQLSQPAPASTPAAERVLTISILKEPDYIAAQAPLPSQNATDFYTRMFNAYLDLYDDQGRPLPYLAEALPQLNTDSWVVFPDGRMETRYHLKPNLVWHDGHPLTADDFVFGFQAASPTKGFRTAVAPYTMMQEVVAPDDRTVIVRWKGLYPDAGVLLGAARFGLVPLPRHLVESMATDSTEAVQGNPYWAREFVGLGPYKLDRWELGSHLEAVAFDQHILGRPKIDRIRLVFMPDPNVAFANMLAGTTHMALDSLNFANMEQLKHEWASSHTGTAGITVASLASVYFQLRPEYASPRAILDVRVRRAMSYGIDRQTVADTIWSGELKPMDSIFAPSADYYPTIERALTKYPYDPRTSERLMTEAGYTKGPDGFFASPTEGQLTFALRAPPTRPELPALASNWRQAGFDVQERPASAAEANSAELGSTFPTFNLAASGGSEVQQMAIYRASEVRTAESRWRGENLSGWISPAYEQLADAFNTTLDPNERIQQRAQIAKLLTEELPALPMTYNPNMHAYLASVKNVVPVQIQTTGRMTWNIERWELQ